MGKIDEVLSSVSLADYASRQIVLKRKGGEYKGCCPFHKENTPSFTIYKKDGKEQYKCFGCGAHGDVIDFVEQYHGVDRDEALNLLNGSGTWREETKKRKDPPLEEKPLRVTKQPSSSDPICDPDYINRSFRVGKPSRLWTYQTKDGATLYHVARFERGEGKKEVIPFTWDGSRWAMGGWTNGPSPLWNLPTLEERKEGTVIVVEGEKAAEALQKIMRSAVVVTWQGGTSAWKKTDWSPLRGRKVNFIPDHDEAGWKAALEICHALEEIGTLETWVVDHRDADLDKGWDIADGIEDGWDVKACGAFVKKYRKEFSQILPNEEEPPPPEPMDLPPPEPQDMPDDAPPADDPSQQWRDDARTNLFRRFRCLGRTEGGFVFWSRDDGQIFQFRRLGTQELLTLADWALWNQAFPKGEHGRTVNWEIASDWVMRQSQFGYAADKIRGRGVWEDCGRSIMNAGDRIYVDGEPMKNTDFEDTDWIYGYGPRIEVDLDHPASVEEIHDFLVMLTKIRWADKKKHAMFLAGWIATAPICGALPWRSHAYLHGPAGAGKTTVIEICKRMLGQFLLSFQSSTTEAGLRRSLAKSSMPVAFDEFDGNSTRDQARMAAIMALARACSSGSDKITIAGTVGVDEFSVRSQFMFAGINVATENAADDTRQTMLALVKQSSSPSRDRADYEEFQATFNRLVKDGFSQRLMARCVLNVATTVKTWEIFYKAIMELGHEARFAQQQATFFAGYWSLISDTTPGLQKAMEMVQSVDLSNEIIAETSSEAENCLATIMAKTVQVHGDNKILKMTMLGVAERLKNHTYHGISQEALEQEMEAFDMKVKDGKLYIASNSPIIKAHLKRQDAGQWQRYGMTLKQLPYVRSGSDAPAVWLSGKARRCVEIDLEQYMEAEPTPQSEIPF